jgi:hypothetical protein
VYFFFNCPLNKRVGSLGGNTTVVILVSSHFNVSIVAPMSGPRILNDPVISTNRVSSVAYYKDFYKGLICGDQRDQRTVVKIVQVVLAVGVKVNARAIVLKMLVGSINRNGNRSNSSHYRK